MLDTAALENAASVTLIGIWRFSHLASVRLWLISRWT